MQKSPAFSSPAPSFCVGGEERTRPAFSENQLDLAEPPANSATNRHKGGTVLRSKLVEERSGASPELFLEAGARGSGGHTLPG